jgi:ATP-dependent protease ClpP protease subunit
VEADGVHIYFYSDVNRDKVLTLVQLLHKANAELVQHQEKVGVSTPAAFTSREERQAAPKIYLHIHSVGGELLPAYAAVDAILNSRFPVVTIVEGEACSAATLLSVVGFERRITRHSFMLIHELRSGMWGRFSDIAEQQEQLTKQMAKLRQIYERHSKLEGRRLDRILRKELYWDAEECIRHGLVDVIVGGNEQ